MARFGNKPLSEMCGSARTIMSDPIDPMSGGARQRARVRPLDEAALVKGLRRLLPRKNDYGAINYTELLGELAHFGVATPRDLRQLILRHRHEAIRIDSEPFDALNARLYRAELGEAAFLYCERRRIFFNLAGLVRVILELEFEDKYRSYSEAHHQSN